MKQTFLRVAKATGLFALSRRLTRRELRILCYHGIWIGDQPHFGDALYMRAETFARRMQALAASNYPVLPLDEAVRRFADGTLPDAAVVITIDDAWLGTLRHMVPVLQGLKLPATLYVTTYYALAERPVLNVMISYMVSRAAVLPPLDELIPGGDASVRGHDDYAGAIASYLDGLDTLDTRWQALAVIAGKLGADFARIAEERWFDLMNPDELRQAQAAGIDLQLHTHTHRMHDFDAAALQNELQRNRTALATTLGLDPARLDHFCFPSGVYDPMVFPVLEADGIQSATTTEFGLNPPDANRFELKRILDCESFSDLDLEARLSGFWSLLDRLRGRAARLRGA